MREILSLLLPLFVIPTNYKEVLRRLGGFALYETYIVTHILREIPTVDGAFTAVESFGPAARALSELVPQYEHLNAAGLGLAIGYSLLTQIFHLHDRISDVIGIRRRFDHNWILKPLAKLVGVHLSAAQEIQLRDRRDSLMRQVFYCYASDSGDGRAVVDRHDVEHAIGAWSWYWAMSEAAFLSGAVSVVSFVFGSWVMGGAFLGGSFVLVLFCSLQHLRLRRYAKPQIEAIANDAKASGEVRKILSAL